MVEKALLIALVCGGLLVLASVAQHYSPIALAADQLGALSCPESGWSAAACAAE